MLNMGFVRILRQFGRNSTRTADSAFSAHNAKAILEITNSSRKCGTCEVTKKELTVPNIEQFYYEVKPKNKEEVLSVFWIFIHRNSPLYFVIRRNR